MPSDTTNPEVLMRTTSTTRGRGAHIKGNDHAAHDRFGGLDLPASLAGALAALGALALLGALTTSWVNVMDTDISENDALSLGGAITALVIVAVSALFGGWVAGRCSRYEGLGNGVITGLLLILFTGGLGILAASQADDVTTYNLPSWVTDQATSNQTIFMGLAGIAVILLAAAIGGLWGGFWHRRVDNLLVDDVERRSFDTYPEETQDRTIDLDAPRDTYEEEEYVEEQYDDSYADASAGRSEPAYVATPKRAASRSRTRKVT
jgi:hypothetical protein